MDEQQLLDRIAIDAALAALTPAERDLILLAFKYAPPAWYTGKWPLSLKEVGEVWGLRYEGVVWSEATIRYKCQAIKDRWRGVTRRQNRRRRPRPTTAADTEE